jgi:hypothetical protein
MVIHAFDHIKLASDKDSEKSEEGTGKKALAIGGSAVAGGVVSGYSAYKGMKDKEEGKNHVGRHAAGHGAIGAVGSAAIAARHIYNTSDVNAGAKRFERKKTKLARIAKNKQAIMKRMKKFGLIAGGVGAGLGALKGAAAYGAGRLAVNKTTKKDNG